jgi:glutathione S-transferase
MLTLYHHTFTPRCRFIRLIMAECGLSAEFVQEHAWRRRSEFLALNPAGQVPVLIENEGTPVCGAQVIMEYLDETMALRTPAQRLMPDSPDKRAEMRRLVDWFLVKMGGESVDLLVHEKIHKLEMTKDAGGGPPDSKLLRVARANLRHHMRYIGYLANNRNWLAGDALSYADLAAAAHLSVADYLGEVPWGEDEYARTWYSRVKSRPAFRPLLIETVRGLPAAKSYADLDF